MALDFASVKGITLPEGAAKALSIGGVEVWSAEAPTPTAAPLCFTAQEANSSVSLNKIGTLTKGQAVETSTDGNTWTAYTFDNVISLPSIGDKVYFRGDNVALGESSSKYCRFDMTGTIAASGNVMSLLDKTCELRSLSGMSSCFRRLFSGCTSLVTAPELPATTLVSACYREMFSGCTSLETAPELPATKLDLYCYYKMFSGCTSLVTAPELPATTLNSDCYYSLFSGCTSLSSICVSFTKWGSNTADWVTNVATSGTFRCPSALPDERGSDKIPSGWTIIHTDA